MLCYNHCLFHIFSPDGCLELKLEHELVVVEHIRQIDVKTIDVPGATFQLQFLDLKVSNLLYPHCHYFPIDEKKRSFANKTLLDSWCKVFWKENQEIEVIKHIIFT